MRILIMLFLANSLILSANDFKVKGIGEKESLFPYVVSKTKEKAGIAENINTYLHLEFLELLPNSYKKSPFEAINDDGGMPRLSIYSYSMKENHKFISMDMDMEGCGAYCESFDTYKVFLAKTGQRIESRDLFTSKGLKAFNTINHKRIQKRIKDFLKSNSRDPEQVEMYEMCLTKEYKGKIDANSEFSIYDDKFIFYSGRCSNHAMRCYDDIGDFENSYSLKSLEKYLTPLGKYLLDKKRKFFVNRTSDTGLYKGKIAGKYPIKLFISSIYDDDSLSAFYWYDKYKKVIDLSGSYRNGKLELYVKRHDARQKKWIPIESIIGRFINHEFKGKWKNLETNKSFSLEMVLN